MTPPDDPARDPRLTETTRDVVLPDVDALSARLRTVPALTVLHHRDARRVGEVARLRDLFGGHPASLSRLSPAFAAPGEVAGEVAGRPLADPHLSRRPIRLAAAPRGGITLSKPGGGMRLAIDGAPLEVGERSLPREALARGVVLELAGSTLLLLHLVGPARRPRDPQGLVGSSEAIEAVRDAIARIADLDVPVLVTGETGTGKELVARAVHEAGRRAQRPFISVNMAAVPAATAAAELFGHARGAFTGADRDRPGFFEQADGGTLFLDEIADTPPDVQAMLLRVLETGEIQRVGGRGRRTVDVRLVAASDADLAGAAARGRFRLPLLHRLSGYPIQLPALRDRRDDLARLLVHFLRDALGSDEQLRDPGAGPPWLPLGVSARLLAHPWPGNVRELLHVARRLVITCRDAPAITLDAALERSLGAPEPDPAAQPARAVESIGDAELAEVLRRHAWRPSRAARELGISRTTMYRLIDASPQIRKAADLSREELVAARDAAGHELDRMVDLLEVSRRGLQLRMKELGLAP